MIPETVASLLFFLVGIRGFRWIRNYFEALSYGPPIVLLPISSNEPLWIIFRSFFAWVQHLSLGLGNWYLRRPILRLFGENFVLCSPVNNTIVTCEPAVVQQVWGETRDLWRMPESQSQLFTFFGQNVSSTHGEDWKRHRKVTVQAFSERTMAGVLDLEGENVRSLGSVRSMFDVLAMQVLTVVAFGQETELVAVPPRHRQSLMESLGFILKHVLLTVVFSSLRAPDWLLPSVLRKLKVSVAEVRLYMQELVLAHMQSTTSRVTTEGSRPASLIEAMVTANELEKQGNTGVKKRSFLTDSELYGNIFVYNLGGFETRASTLTFAFPFLAIYPEIQTWIAEELDEYAGAKHGVDVHAEQDYTNIYPRTRALIYETLRLASPAPLFVRTPLAPATLVISTPKGPKNIIVKPGTLVGMIQYAAHLSPRLGPSAEAFNPKRFITVDENGAEKFQLPDGPVYAAWMLGPRMCPAKKFSQVEFAGIMAGLLGAWRIEVLQEGESVETARARVERVLRDEKYFNISARLKRLEVAGVRFVLRA
ncbi:putative cytochrome P450 [Lizonia empirigonia]|nr:putative cytochrome P450 [Lizonia empirigonia]